MRNKRGFTLTELTVAIAFISILLLTIAVVTMNMVNNYHKGLTMKAMNTDGLALIDEFSSAVAESPVFDAESLCKTLGDIGTKGANGFENGTNGANDCMNDDAKQFIYQQYFQEIKVTKNGVENKLPLPTSGVFCTGKYSYVWNTGYVLPADSHTMSSGFYSEGRRLSGDFRLRKYADPGRNFCRNNFPKDGSNVTVYPLIPSRGIKYISTNAVGDSAMTEQLNNNINALLSSQTPLSAELISTSDIALYSVVIETPSINKMSGRSLYTGSFILGSITGDIELKEGDSRCKIEGSSSFDVEYCATNKFNFAMRAMGGNSGN